MTRLPALLLAPVVLAQGRALRRDVPRLPPPPEPWSGGDPDAVGAARLVVLGDSTAVGTGVGSPAEALAGQLAGLLDGIRGWSALGANGLTSAEVRADVLPEAVAVPAGLAVVVIGWNDALHLRTAAAFAADLTALVEALAGATPTRRVVIVGPPRFDRLDVLPQPLRWALGAHARGLAARAARVAAATGAVLAPGFDGASVASDRFHPDAAGYARMAAGIRDALRDIDRGRGPGPR